MLTFTYVTIMKTNKKTKYYTIVVAYWSLLCYLAGEDIVAGEVLVGEQ